MKLRAVIFDYGMVLSGPQEPRARAELLRITGLGPERFDDLYWTDRRAYDVGTLTGLAYWEKMMADSGLELGPEAIEELNLWDARMWTTENPPMLAWQGELKRRGVKTAILSNMGDNILANMKREFDWLDRFDVQIWSFQHGMAKPDERIYRLTLDKLGVEAAETLFVDDRAANVEMARRLGMAAAVFTTVERLREDLVGLELDGQLPMPG